LLSCHGLVVELRGLQSEQAVLCFPHPNLAGSE
jgi:hypothetical protein